MVKEIIPDKNHTIVFSNSSKQGKYVSLNLETRVDSEENRLDIYRRLMELDDVKIVI